MHTPLSIAVFAILTLVCQLHAATVTALGATVSTYISNLTPDEDEEFNYLAVDPTTPTLPTPFESRRIANFQGNGTDAEALAIATDLVYSVPDGTGTIAYSGTNILKSSVDESASFTKTSEKKLDIGTFAEYVITFELAEGETKMANLDMTYRIAIDNEQANSALVSWELQGPSNNRIDGLSFDDLRLHNPAATPPSNSAIDDTVDVESSVILTGAGTYTFTIFTQIPQQEFNNGKKSAIAEVTSFYAEVVNIPEPSSTSFILLASTSLLMRRHRRTAI